VEHGELLGGDEGMGSGGNAGEGLARGRDVSAAGCGQANAEIGDGRKESLRHGLIETRSSAEWVEILRDAELTVCF
jgi:hypothetical protein